MLAFPEGERSSGSRTRRSGPTATRKMEDPQKVEASRSSTTSSNRCGRAGCPSGRRTTGRDSGTSQMHDLPRKPAFADRLARELPEPGEGQRGDPASLWKDLDLIVDINYRMDTTALYSDVVLPASVLLREDRSELDRLPFVHAPVLEGARSALRVEDRLGHFRGAGARRSRNGRRHAVKLISGTTTSTGSTISAGSWTTGRRRRARHRRGRLQLHPLALGRRRRG